MFAAVVQIIAQALVLDPVLEDAVVAVPAVLEGVLLHVHRVAQEAVLGHVLVVARAVAQADVLVVVRGHVLTLVRVVPEVVWATALVNALAHAKELVQHLATDGTIINIGF